MKCRECGEKFSVWSAKAPGGMPLCNNCWEKRSKADVQQLARSVVPNEHILSFGAAYWETLGSTARVILARSLLLDVLLLRCLGMTLTGTGHRAGLIAVTKSEFIVVDIGMIRGEEFTLEKLRMLSDEPKVKRAPLRQVQFSIEAEPDVAFLTVSGAISIRACFPDLVEPGNAAKAKAIVGAASTSR